MNKIIPEMMWKCPKDDVFFNDPHYRCRHCEFFERLKKYGKSILVEAILCSYDTSKQTIRNGENDV